MENSKRIVITGAAGLVGQNLILLLKECGYTNIIAIDKNKKNSLILRQLNPEIEVMIADLSKVGEWEKCFVGCDVAVLLHAQVTSKNPKDFINNNIVATELCLEAIRQSRVPYIVHVSSSVINSIATDDYTNTKLHQEQLVINSGINHCVLRPTLMFGWFDPKHLGWLSRFMEKIPVFPIPGHGRYLRQPLYCRDFCKIILAAIKTQPNNSIYDIVGNEEIHYIDMIKEIKRVKNLKTKIIKIPYRLFYFFMKLYGWLHPKPPFTSHQLKALSVGDYFVGVNTVEEFGINLTPFQEAVHEAFNHPEYSNVILKRS